MPYRIQMYKISDFANGIVWRWMTITITITIIIIIIITTKKTMQRSPGSIQQVSEIPDTMLTQALTQNM